MNSFIFVPETMKIAGAELRRVLANPLDRLPKQDFIRAWSSVAYLFPGLHPDGFKDAENGWPRTLQRFVTEAWRRADAGELDDEELYPSDAQWSGLYDRMSSHTADETERRRGIAALSVRCIHA